MTPRQVITMVTCWAAAPAIIAAAIALPAGTALEPVVARAVVSAQAGPAENIGPLVPGTPGRAVHNPGAPGERNTRPPHQQLLSGNHSGGRAPGTHGIFARFFGTAGQNPYTPGEFALLALAGLAIALAGALGPAIWAAASRTTTALRAE